MTTQTKPEVPIKGTKPERGLARYVSPFEEYERFFDQLLPRGWLSPLRWDRPLLSELATLESRMPRVDVVERDNEVVVKAEVPGVKKEDIQITIAGNRMTIKGESKHEEKEEKADYYRCEISRGAFSRSVTLPAEVDETKAKAEMKYGMLEITLPKTEQTKKAEIKIT
ncbi:MAG: Hsp20/alpha crystallin family protein [Burkholderiales bacterium]